jgi:hypothetical protein
VQNDLWKSNLNNQIGDKERENSDFDSNDDEENQIDPKESISGLILGFRKSNLVNHKNYNQSVDDILDL